MKEIKTAVEKIKLSLEQFPIKVDSDEHGTCGKVNKVPTYDETEEYPKSNTTHKLKRVQSETACHQENPNFNLKLINTNAKMKRVPAQQGTSFNTAIVKPLQP